MTARRGFVFGGAAGLIALAADADDLRQMDRTQVRRIAAPVYPPSNPVYYPYQMTTVAGTLEAGTTVADVARRGVILHWDEVSGAPGFDIIFDWQGVPQLPDHLYVTGWYNGNHYPRLQLWDYTAGDWVVVHTYHDFGSTGAGNVLSIAVPLEARHYNAGALRARFYHGAAGSTSHDMYIDFVGVR